MGPFGTSTATLSENACNVEPPDVAADISPTEMAEFTNFGLQAWDKVTVTPKFSSPISFSNFWCSGGSNGGSIPCTSTSQIGDTQIVWNPPTQQWLAASLYWDPSAPGGPEGDVLFAVSRTSDAAGQWNTYSIQHACSQIDSAHPFIDQPIVGFNGYWIVIEGRCYVSDTGPRGTKDALAIIQNNPIPATMPPTIAAPFLDAVPSRDVKSTPSNTYTDLFLLGDYATNPNGPSLLVAALDHNKSITVLASSPSIGDLASSPQVPDAICGANCKISSMDQSRPKSVVLQTANDGYHYLMTSYAAEDSTNSEGEVMYYVGRAETLRTSSSLWNTWWIGGWPSSGGSAAFPTITADDDLDFAYAFETFQSGSSQTPYNNWYEAKGFITNLPGIQSPPLMGSGISYDQESGGAYTGCSQYGTQRWGDYMSMLWDSSYSDQGFAAPSGENSAFWTVAETSSGGSNQTTSWVSLNDPLPFFAGSSVPNAPSGTYGENECGFSGIDCKLVYTAPLNAQPGDLFVAEVNIGEGSDVNHLTLPTGWVALPMVNHSGQYSLLSWGNGFYTTSFLAAYIYGSQANDPGSYTFKVLTQTNTSELIGFLFSYRGATMIPTNLSVYGYGVTALNNFASTNRVTPSGQTTLASLFVDDCYGKKESKEGTAEMQVQFTAPSGSPVSSAETSLNPDFLYLVSDAGVPIGGNAYGPYSTTTCTGVNFAYNVIVPEL